MGKSSNPDAIRSVVRLLMEWCSKSVRLWAVIAMALGLAAPVVAQTQATTLPLLLPSAVAFDAQGNFYFAETGNHVVRKVSPSGVITTVAGNGVQGFAGDNGLATAAELDSPAGLALDSAGNLYIADSHNHRIREVFAATGKIVTVAGAGSAGFSGDGGLATAAQLDLPTALALNAAGDIYIADTNNHRVRRIVATTGVVTTVAGNGVESFAGDGGVATAASIDSPNGLAVDAAGNLYIADTRNGRLREVNAASGLISTVAGMGGAGFSGDGGPATAAGLALPRGLTIDTAGNLYFADSANHRIRRISPAGTITTVVGQGTESFAGDGSLATAASLDSPRAVAISQAGLLTVADTGNQRLRQIDALAVSGSVIHTVAGVGTTTVSILSLSGPSAVVYGSSTVAATLANATNATGSVTFMDANAATQVTLGTANLSAGSATFNAGALSAGAHSIVAIYAGDANYAATQSAALAMTVTPLAITAAASPVSILYGQAVPALSGTLSGVLAQDAGKVSATFTTSAVAMSPVGAYPIVVTLTGSAASNYALSSTPVANLSIAQAPTLTALSTSINSVGAGLPVTLTVQAASTTSGVPSGKVTLLDGTTVLSAVPLVAGTASFTTSSLALGANNLSATYAGDTNFLPSSSASAMVAVVAASDFTLTATGATSQSIPAGSAATYSFSVGVQGAAIASPITLSVQGVPLGASSSLNPAYIPPGGAVTSFTLTIQTAHASVDERSRPFGRGQFGQSLLAILLLPVFGLARRGRRMLTRGSRSAMILFVAVASCVLCVALTSGCGDRVNTNAEAVNTTPYTLTVIGIATGSTGTALQHSVNVTLQVIQ